MREIRDKNGCIEAPFDNLYDVEVRFEELIGEDGFDRDGDLIIVKIERRYK